MVDQPEGRPKSPKPGKVKTVTKKHNVSKPYERPSSSRVGIYFCHKLIQLNSNYRLSHVKCFLLDFCKNRDMIAVKKAETR